MHKNLFKRLSRHLPLLGALALLPASALAVPAYPGIIQAPQPDGSVLPIRLHGDEHHHYTSTTDGFMLLRNADGYYEYAQPADRSSLPAPSGVRALPAPDRSPEQARWLASIDQQAMLQAALALPSPRRAATGEPNYIFTSTAFPCTGQPHSLVILVSYNDVGFSSYDAHDYYDRMLNAPWFYDDGNSGSVFRYFSDSSKGLFEPVFDVYGPVQLSRERDYYGENDAAGNDIHVMDMIVEACTKLHDEGNVDFSRYDHNNDGFVDNIYVIYAGVGEASSHVASSVWPCSWELALKNKELNYDGVTISKFGCSNELRANRKPDGIGTFVHEFSHILGIPDFYDTRNSYNNATPGSWSVMDQGPYNNDGCTPPAYSAFERYSLGWIEPAVLARTGDYSLADIKDGNDCFIVSYPKNAKEFFLFENRQQKGWDQYLPGHGMLIWHIEFSQSVWDDNTPNNSADHQRVDLVEADNKYGDFTNDADAWPGPRKKTIFSTSTQPAFLSWSGRALGISSLSDIAENDGLITFHATADASSAPVLDASCTGPARYFSLDGRELASPPGHGIYIVRDPRGARAAVR